MTGVLIAPLGESPIVVTAMVEALERHPNGPHSPIDVVEVLYPTGQGNQFIGFGFDLIEDVLRNRCKVRGHALSFSDANTEDSCVEYLRVLDGVLEGHRQDDVYISVAGGRKSMAAVTAVITQFHPQVRGLYHLLDRHEADPARRSLKTNEELFNMSDGDRRDAMMPATENLKLVELPFHPLADAVELRRYLKAGAQDATFSIAVDDAGFFERIFGAQALSERLELRLSAAAYEQFVEHGVRAANIAGEFRSCFWHMAYPEVLKSGKHGGPFAAGGRVFFFFKRRRTRARPFFYTEPNPIDFYPGPARPVKRVVIAGLSWEQSDGSYKPSADEWLSRAPYDATYTLEKLPPQPGILLVPLGESPMVVTQTFVLLREREGIRVERVVLLYPGDDPPIRSGARLVKELFERPNLRQMRGSEPVSVEEVPIEGVQDMDSRDACDKYGRALGSEIARLQYRYPDHPLHLSLSGGRKATAVLTYFGAQQAGISQVWHTTIGDPDLDRQVERDTSSDKLAGLTAEEKARRLFLQAYDRDKFTIFRVPVIPLKLVRPGES